MKAAYGRQEMQNRSVGWRIAVGMCVAAAAVWGSLACAAVTNPHGIAVIVGNNDYEHTEDVTFAHRDAEAFGRYVVEILGFDPGRVLYLKDAKKMELETMFGIPGYNRGEIWKRLDEEGRSDVVVFYSGHGVPGLQDRRGYLVPVNAQPDSAELTGYSLDVLWENLAKLKARSVAVYVDACFSGESAAGTLFKGTSAVRVQAPLPEEGDGRMTLLTAASGKQVALWDQQAKHGLFTKHLLDGLYGGADANEDGRVTAGEAKAYLDRKMTPAARRGGKEQKAQLKGAAEKVLSAARFPARSSREAKALGADLEKVRKEKDAVDRERVRLARALEAKQAEMESVRRERDAAEQARLALEARLGRLSAEQGGELEKVRKEKEAVSRERQRLARKVAEQQAELERLRGEQQAAKAGARQPRVGEEFRACGEAWCPWMVVVPQGEFTMGSPESESGRILYKDEGPRHQVRIGTPFAVGKYEVTFREWDACVAGGAVCKGYQPE